MGVTVTYVSRRNEVLKWYWRAWRRRLWKLHVIIFLSVAIVFAINFYGKVPGSIQEWGTVALVGFAPLLLLFTYPMLAFKSKSRVLTADENGIDTTIGITRRIVPWSDVVDVREDGEAVVIERRNGNAFIVPVRAFKSGETRRQFLAFVRRSGTHRAR